MMWLNTLLGTLVVAVGFWLLWGNAVPFILLGWTLAVGVFLGWKSRSIAEVWAWSTLLLGLESLAWPLLLMSQLSSATSTPSDEQMGTVLSAVVLGLFSSVFWMSFSYGLFKRSSGGGAAATASAISIDSRPTKRKKTR